MVFFRHIVPKWPKHRERQNWGIFVGLLLGCLGLSILLWSGQDRIYAKGAANPGHENLECSACHRPATGNTRQQVQAEVQHFLGFRKSSPDFGNKKVDNEACLDCHSRPNDRHPVFRFGEPRFAEARAAIDPMNCNSCHLEHTGKRVTVGMITYCQYCHQDTRINNDPITIPHTTLIANKQWNTCLGCHDFHGNHVMPQTETDLSRVIPEEEIWAYFNGGASPYPKELHYPAKDTLP